MTDYLVPCILFFASAFALGRKENSYDILLHGAGEGLRLLLSIVPSLILLMTAIHAPCVRCHGGDSKGFVSGISFVRDSRGMHLSLIHI